MPAQKTILIVDDEPSVRLALTHALGRPEWSVESVDSAEEALALFQQNPRDLLLVDKNFPGMTGTELVEAIRGMGSDAAVIMMTGFASSESALEMARHQVDAYIEKPFSNIFDVVKRVEAALAKRAARRAAPPARERRPRELSQTNSGLQAARSSFMKAGSMLSKKNGPAPSKRSLQLLVITPDNDDRSWIARVLSKSARLHMARSSQEGIEIAAGSKIDVVVADLSISDPDFFGLVERLRAASSATRFMAIADRPSLHTVTKLIDFGVNAIVDKPFVEHKLAREFAKLVRI
jgi:DNA-binding NtrC family response regulator